MPTGEIEDSLIGWLQRWYESQCDGTWEHQYGISIDTVDNPGWSFRADLNDTKLSGRTLGRVRIEPSDTDWMHYWVENDRFEAAGGPRNLHDILQTFRDWVESMTS
jgi:hypothetical protein